MRHPLITISNLQSLTDAELERLEATLRHILETYPSGGGRLVWVGIERSLACSCERA